MREDRLDDRPAGHGGPGEARRAELVFVRPHCQVTPVAEQGLAKRQAASVDLKQLAAIGILSEHEIGYQQAMRQGLAGAPNQRT